MATRSRHAAAMHGHAHGGPRLYDALVDVFFLGRRRAAYRTLIAAAGVQPGHRVLDVGCGTGYFARLLARAVGPDGLVVGVDPSPEMVAHAIRGSRFRRDPRRRSSTVAALGARGQARGRRLTPPLP